MAISKRRATALARHDGTVHGATGSASLKARADVDARAPFDPRTVVSLLSDDSDSDAVSRNERSEPEKSNPC
jgi:hypothetical protein